ncbi:MAG: hypothetical protein ABS69_05310 [Nitrosomonadales bacterium SCN 54-20]|nr:MAG: hypothetical protein ABS69_05310 [Nitrosomonadales bacterium SCN 54-20]
MRKPWENDSCEHVQSYYTIYPVPVAAALWCGIPPSEIKEHLDASTQVYRAVYRHPYIPCLEPRCRAMHEAIEKGALLVSRENGQSFDGKTDHVAPERRHVARQNLKEWIAREFPADKPAFLFDEIERKTHAAINADAFRALQADRDAVWAELEKAKARMAETIREMDSMRGERDSLRAMIDKASAPGGRSEKTYLNIIGGLLALMLGKSPAGKPQSSFENQGAIISAMLGHYGHVKGMGDSNLEKIMAEANKTLKDSALTGG